MAHGLYMHSAAAFEIMCAEISAKLNYTTEEGSQSGA
jgi:hypothetical protein